MFWNLLFFSGNLPDCHFCKKGFSHHFYKGELNVATVATFNTQNVATLGRF